MKTAVDPELREIMEVPHYRPALSIILPVDTDVSLKTEAAHTLKTTADKAEQALKEFYPEEYCDLIMQKLHSLIDELDIPANSRGIALFVSPLFKKVCYLDFPVTEKIIVDDSFEIRDLLYNARQNINFIVVMLSGRGSKVFTGDRISIQPLHTNIPATVDSFIADTPERVTNFTDMTEHKQNVLNKFLLHVDEALDDLLQQYRLPVLLIGTKKTLGQFKKISKGSYKTIGYVEGNYEKLTTTALTKLIQPFINSWQENNQQEILKRLDEAAGQHRLTTGILQVWQAVQNGHGKLLVVEKNFRFAAQHGPQPDIIEPAIEPYNHFTFIRDAVDDVIEKILMSGGEVEFIENGRMIQYDHIALINYYPQ
ncbi:hypothetical protein GWR56_06875 [Mucilaginibacter sp. 14171R-50]|uniref:baeRF3 domain-containing protein n=1 Tax=Mucilaginibacter sp. 14171R-50 TaxID=2703789 RepID=UPI00138C55CD|nr:hypothetical protein [Mucilaginibacter sp. 14171R-50]QHS55277.1 hypothetical protein GWR56_06875 [Mucilaginibacter sp. 14171R-50]